MSSSHLDNITDDEAAGPGDLGKNALPRHYTIAKPHENLTLTVAVLSNLCNFKPGALADVKLSTDLKGRKVYTFCCYVLGETARADSYTFFNKLIYRFCSEQTYLPVPITGMSISNNTEAGAQLGFGDVGFLRSLFF